MQAQSKQDFYTLKNDLNQQHLIAILNRSLCHAEALAVVASIIDIESVGTEIMDNYLWVLSDVIQEAKYLCTKLSLIQPVATDIGVEKYAVI